MAGEELLIECFKGYPVALLFALIGIWSIVISIMMGIT